MTSLVNLSRKELLAACETLIREVGQERAQAVIGNVVKAKCIQSIASANEAEAQASAASSQQQPSKKLRKEFDFSRYPQKHVAFWVGYFGERYNGLATASVKGGDDKTVEWSFLHALKKVRLIDPDGDFETWNFSRCGRTDKGVSALGQVISLKVRSVEGETHMDYATMLNSSLPSDIIVLAWAPVDGLTTQDNRGGEHPFDARFSCRSRTYRYFFRKQSLDLGKMQDACLRLVGTHDFRNFCKIDLNNVKTFERKIDACEIHECESDSGHTSMYYVEVRGSAFLWHQIRLIMAVLFHVGAGLEDPSIVDYLLDTEKCPGRPSFGMASELPLLLHTCAFDPDLLKWQFSEKNVAKVVSRLNARLGEDLVRCELTRSFLDVLTKSPFPPANLAGDLDHEEIGMEQKRMKHKRFVDRLKCKSVEEHMRDFKPKQLSPGDGGEE